MTSLLRCFLVASLFCASVFAEAQKLDNIKFGYYNYIQPSATDALNGSKNFVLKIELKDGDAYRKDLFASGLDTEGFSEAPDPELAEFEIFIKEYKTSFTEATKSSSTEKYKEDGVEKSRTVYSYSSSASWHFAIFVYDKDRNELFREDIKGGDKLRGPSSTSIDRAHREYLNSKNGYKEKKVNEQVKALSEKFNEHFADLEKSTMVRGINIKAKKMDYDDFHAGFEGLEKAYAILAKSDGSTDESIGLINAAIPEFEKVLNEADLEDKKARVNADVAAAAHYDLGLAYFFNGDFTNSQKHFDEAVSINKKVAFDLRTWAKKAKKMAERQR